MSAVGVLWVRVQREAEAERCDRRPASSETPIPTVHFDHVAQLLRGSRATCVKISEGVGPVSGCLSLDQERVLLPVAVVRVEPQPDTVHAFPWMTNDVVMQTAPHSVTDVTIGVEPTVLSLVVFHEVDVRYRRFATSVSCVRVPPREPDPSFPILEYHSTDCGLNVHKGGIKTVLTSGTPGSCSVRRPPRGR